MQTALGQNSPLVFAASPIGGPALVAIGGVVVVLAILLVFVMVLRGNGGARNASRGIGFDAQEGPIGQPRAPMSQPNGGRPRAASRQQAPWSMDNDMAGGNGGPASTGWGGYGEQPSQPAWGGQPAAAPGAPQGWGDQPAWGAPAAPAAPGRNPVGAAPGTWDSPAGGPPAGVQDAWGQGGPQGWAAPPTAPRGWDVADAGARPAAAPSRDPWGAPPAVQPNSSPDWGRGAPSPSAPFEMDKTRVARPAVSQGLASVVVRQGKEPGRTYELRRERTTIGRSRESDIFLEDLAVSRLHSTINRDPSGQYFLRDEQSANGTLVNGQRVTDHLLEEGDEIQVGQTILAFVHR